MRFSFIIPVYGTERELPRCLDSLVAQTDRDFDAVVVDDGSPARHDGVPRAEEVVARCGSRFRCVRHERNLGLFQARATGALESSADYVIPLDSDDYVMPRLVETIRRELDSSLRPSPDILVYHMSKEKCGKIWPVKYNRSPGCCTGAEALRQFFDGRIFNPICGKVIRRELMARVYRELDVGRDFYLNSTEDLCWLVPILICAKSVRFVSYDGYRYVQSEDSLSRATPSEEWFRKMSEQCRRSVDTVAAYAERKRLPPQLVAEIRRQILPVVRWLLRTYTELPDGLFPADVIAEASRMNRMPKWMKLVSHIRKYGIAATYREALGYE